MSYCKCLLLFVAALAVLHSPCVAQASELGGKMTASDQTLGSSAEEIAEQANKLFNSDDDGVYFRMTPPDLKAVDQEQTHTTTQSFVLLNKYAWYKDIIKLYKDGARPAYMAKPQAHENVACLYPCDGDSMDRHYSCHVKGCPCDASGKDDWCDHALGGEPHKPCAFKPNEAAKMLGHFKEVQELKSSLLKNKACGYHFENGRSKLVKNKPGESTNEVVMDPRPWDAHVKDYLWAFVLTDACTGTCAKNLTKLHEGYTKKYGYIPILSFHRHDKEHPFHASHSPSPSPSSSRRRRRRRGGSVAADEEKPGGAKTEEDEGREVAAADEEKASDASETVAATSKDEDEVATNMSIRVGQASYMSKVLV